MNRTNKIVQITVEGDCSNLTRNLLHCQQGDQNTRIVRMGHKLRYLTTQPTVYLLQRCFNTLYDDILSNIIIYFTAEV